MLDETSSDDLIGGRRWTCHVSDIPKTWRDEGTNLTLVVKPPSWHTSDLRLWLTGILDLGSRREHCIVDRDSTLVVNVSQVLGRFHDDWIQHFCPSRSTSDLFCNLQGRLLEVVQFVYVASFACANAEASAARRAAIFCSFLTLRGHCRKAPLRKVISRL